MIDGLNNVVIYNSYCAAMIDFGVLVVIGLITFALAAKFSKWREDQKRRAIHVVPGLRIEFLCRVRPQEQQTPF